MGQASHIGRVIGAAALALTAGFAAPAAGQQGIEPGRELSRYPDMDSDDVVDQIHQLQQENFATQQLVIVNQFLLRYGARVSLDSVRYDSSGELVPGYVFRAIAADGPQRSPAVVLVHGGFHERLSEVWFPLIVALCEEGYVVMFPEYHGSRGYGEAIYRNDYGVTDTADVLAAADYIAEKPFVARDRIAIVGESRGGMITLLAIEKAPRRFRAAVDIVGLTDFVAYMSYKPDYRRQQIAEENPSFGGALPNDNLSAYMAVSPINNVDAIETPLLVLANRADTIVPFDLHTGRLLDALKARNKVYESHIYDAASGGHVFMHGDTPERADAFKRIFAWLDRHLRR